MFWVLFCIFRHSVGQLKAHSDSNLEVVAVVVVVEVIAKSRLAWRFIFSMTVDVFYFKHY